MDDNDMDDSIASPFSNVCMTAHACQENNRRIGPRLVDTTFPLQVALRRLPHPTCVLFAFLLKPKKNK